MTAPKVLEFTSPDSPTIVYACSWCGFTAPNERQAERCCRCDECGGKKALGRRWCEACDAKKHRERNEEHRAKMLALPVLEEYDGPVYVDDAGRYFEDTDAAFDYLYDQDLNPADAIVLPCTVSKARTPCIEEVITERWGSHFDDYDADLSEGLLEALSIAQRQAEHEAPDTWRYRSDARLVLRTVA